MNGDLSQTNLQNNETSEVESLKNIRQLQAMEKELYRQLEANVASNSNPDEQSNIIKKINELSQVRIGLFKSLENTYNLVQSSVANSRVDLVDQLTVVGIVENELNTAKAQLNQLDTNKHNKMRMVQINTYFGKRYKAHTKVTKKLIFICIPLLILAILKKKGLIPAIIPDMVIYGISALIILIGGYSLIVNIIDINSRDNMDYDAYNWNFDPASAKPGVYDYNRPLPSINGGVDLRDLMCGLPQQSGAGAGAGCVGDKCCSTGMYFDNGTQKCIANVARETFATGQLTSGVFNGSNDVVHLGNNSLPEPYSESLHFATI